MKEQWDAIVQFYRASEMTKEQRKEVAKWLREKAKDLLKQADNYSTHFLSRFYFK